MSGQPRGEEQERVRVVRFYTAARRFPKLIGRWPDGAPIPGGPYTTTQFVVAILVLVVGYYTMPLWGRGGLLLSGMQLALAVVGVVLTMRKVPWKGRDPLPALAGGWAAYTRSSELRRGGKVLPARAPQQVSTRVVICAEELVEQAQREALAAASCSTQASSSTTRSTTSSSTTRSTTSSSTCARRPLDPRRLAGRRTATGPVLRAATLSTSGGRLPRRDRHVGEPPTRSVASPATTLSSPASTRSASARSASAPPAGQALHFSPRPLSGVQRLLEQATSASLTERAPHELPITARGQRAS